MIEVNKFIFWAVCAMAAIGFLQSLFSLFKPEEKRDWRIPQYPEPGEAPPGFRWVLVKEEE